MFHQLAVPIIDADIIARQVVEKGSPLLEKIVAKFGIDILTAQGELNRAVLRQRIFQSEQDKQWLNNLLHPAIRTEMLAQLNQIQSSYVLWVVPLLIENKLTDFCDRVLVIDVLPEIQFERAIQRDKGSIETIRNIIASQVDRSIRLSYADDVIENNLPLEENSDNLHRQVQQLHQYYQKLARQKEHKNDDCKLPDL